MFLFKLSSWLDRYDPYWYSRLMSLKIVVIAIVVFMVNMLTQPLLSPLMMLIAGAGALIIEMPTINTLDKKDNVYLGYIILMCLTIVLFSATVYLRGWFVVAVCGWAYILYMALKKAPQLYPIVSVVIMLGVMGQEGINTGNYYVILNEVLFILEFAFFVFWAHKLFPRLYHNIWFSSLLRSIEAIEQILAGDTSLTIRQQLFRHLEVGHNTLELLRGKSYLREAATISLWLSYYHYFLPEFCENNPDPAELVQLQADFSAFKTAILQHQEFSFQREVGFFPQLDWHYDYFRRLNYNWNKLC